MALRVGIVSIALMSGVVGVGLSDARSARADEAFLCGPDTVVYVKPSELELKKRTDPCIAAYFGLKVDEGAKAPPSEPTSNAAKPSRKPAAEAAQPAPVELKRLPEPERERSTRAVEERSASLSPPMPAPGTDYRNVRIINASSPGDEWYRHVR